MRAGFRQQRGVALITAIFVVTLATIAAVALISTSDIAIHRTNNLLGSEQGQWYALGVESWICAELPRQSAAVQHSYTSLGDPWAKPLPALPIENGVLTGQLEDLQGRFNLNNLGALNPQPFLEQFQRLLDNIPGIDRSAAADLGPAIRDWIDADGETWPGGAEDDYYLSLAVPYRTANLLMKSPSELLYLRGMTPQLYAAIHPYVATLPTTAAKINVNTASLPVLLSLSTDPGPGLQQFIESRVDDPATSVGDLTQRGLFGKDQNVSPYVDVHSSYFQLTATVEVDQVRTTLYSILYWPGNLATVSSHSFGTD